MQFGTEEIPRLRIGIGEAPPAGSVDYVLSRFFEEEKPEYVFLVAAKVGGINANNIYRADFIFDNLAIELSLTRSIRNDPALLGSEPPKHTERPRIFLFH